MSPKEKAKELIERFYSANQPYTFEVKVAKQSALICVEEIIPLLQGRVDEISATFFWNSVKQEIEKL